MKSRQMLLIQIGIALVSLAGSVYVACSPANSLMRWYNIDDAFYYYKVAQNALGGHGFTFDLINSSNGFHPLWMIVCLGVFWLSKFNLILPLRVLVVVSGLLNAGSALLVFRILHRYIRPVFAASGALFWGLIPAIYSITTVHGMESSASAFFILLLLYLVIQYLEKPQPGRPHYWQLAVIGAVGALTMLARLDNLFLVALLGVLVVFRVKKIPTTLLQDFLLIFFAVMVAFLSLEGYYQPEVNAFSIYAPIVIALPIFPALFSLVGFSRSASLRRKLFDLLKLGFVAVLSVLVFLAIYYLLFKIGIFALFSLRLAGFAGILIAASMCLIRLFRKTPDSTRTGFSLVNGWSWWKSNWRRMVRDMLVFGAPILILVGLYLLQNKLVFGTYTPVSGQIKHWWGSLRYSVYFPKTDLIYALGLSPAGNSGPWSLVTSFLYEGTTWMANKAGIRDLVIIGKIFLAASSACIVLYVLLVRTNHKLRDSILFTVIISLVIGCLAHGAYYFSTGYAGMRSWYWITEMLALVLLGTIALDSLFLWFERSSSTRTFSTVFGGLVIIAILLIHARYIHRLAPLSVTKEHQADYLMDVTALEQLTPKGSIIGMTGGGNIAYFIHDRTIVNMDGLINCVSYFQALKAGTADKFLLDLPLDYVYGNSYMLLETDPYREIFKGRLTLIQKTSGQENFTLYQFQK